MLNYLVVTPDASYTSGQVSDLNALRDVVTRMLNDPRWYKVTTDSPLFVQGADLNGGVMVTLTLGTFLTFVPTTRELVTKVTVGEGREELLNDICEKLARTGYNYDDDYAALYSGPYLFTGIQFTGKHRDAMVAMATSMLRSLKVEHAVVTEAK